MLESVRDVIVTGGAGFIGSHFVDSLMSAGLSVVVIDDFSSGLWANIQSWEDNRRFSLLRLDLQRETLVEVVRNSADLMIHLAANPEVRAAEANPQAYINQQLEVTKNAFELCRVRDIPHFVFASSSTVYGDAEIIPTPEVYGPLRPISAYGKMKLQCEELTAKAASLTGLRGLILRFANIVGSRSRHGVIYDLLRKLQANPKSLQVLGDGTQKKSYLHIQDCLEASLSGLQSHLNSSKRTDIFNVGNSDWLEVSKIAEIASETMGLADVKLIYQPADEGRGWKGDVKEMRLDIERLTRLGWKPRYSSEQAVRMAAKAMLSELRTASA